VDYNFTERKEKREKGGSYFVSKREFSHGGRGKGEKIRGF